jgi:hypothetical protein
MVSHSSITCWRRFALAICLGRSALGIFQADQLAFSQTASDPVKSSGDGFRWIESPKQFFELQHAGRPVLRYMCAPFDDSTRRRRDETYKPFHHVFSPDAGVQLTKGDPDGLYPHHRGLFYGFNQVTYGDGQRCDVWHCTEGAHQSHERVIRQHADADSGGHVVAIDWHGRRGEVFAHEQRGLTVRKRPGGFEIDFTSHLETADGKPIHLDGDPQHAGFHFRAAQEVAASTAKQTYYLRTSGKGALDETRNWEPNGQNAAMNVECENRPWLAMCFVLNKERYTVLYLDHPNNPKPARYSERDYGRFGSYFVADVTSEKPLDVKYRVWVQAGEMTVDECAAKHREFVR